MCIRDSYFSEIYRGGIEAVPKGQTEAGQVLGMTRSQIFFKVTLLQVVKRILPPMGNEIITLVKDTSLANVIANKDIIMMAKAVSYTHLNFLQNYHVEINRFGGLKILIDDTEVDVWRIENTWAYRKGKVVAIDKVESLPKTVFLNMDGIVYDCKRNVWLDREYENAMKTKMLDVVLDLSLIHISFIIDCRIQKMEVFPMSIIIGIDHG